MCRIFFWFCKILAWASNDSKRSLIEALHCTLPLRTRPGLSSSSWPPGIMSGDITPGLRCQMHRGPDIGEWGKHAACDGGNDTDMQEGRLIQPFSKYWPLPLTMMTGQNVARNKHNTLFVTRFLMTNASQVSTLTLCWGIKLEIVLS